MAQSYDWLLFLTDSGLSQFIEDLLLRPTKSLNPARNAFLESYSGQKRANRFTKVRIDTGADDTLQRYFSEHKASIKKWFNVISPNGETLDSLRKDLRTLAKR